MKRRQTSFLLLGIHSKTSSTVGSAPPGSFALGNRLRWTAVLRRILTASLVLFLLALASAWSPVQADPQTIASTDPGFNNGRPLRLSGARVVFSSPTLADLDGDGKLEIIVGGGDGIVYAIRPTGELLWSFQVAQAIDPLVSHPTGDNVIRGAISVADINADGYPEVVVPVGEIDHAEQLPTGHDVNGAVVVLDHRGTVVPGWPVITRDHWGEESDGHSDGVPVSPALGDIDGDGDLEIIAVSFDQQINAWHHDGTRVRGWPKFVHESQWSPIGLADMDGDGSLEIIALVTTQEEPGSDTVQGGDLRIYRPDGSQVCRYTIDQAFTSAPAIGDMDGDGQLEIVSGTGDWYAGPGRGWHVYAWDGNCRLRPGWPVTTYSYMTSAPALADLDRDGKLEVIATSGTIHNSSFDPRIYAWRYDGKVVPGFPVTPITAQGNTSYPLSPIVADWNADGRAEIFTSFAWEVGALRADGTQYTYRPGGVTPGKTFWARYTLNNTPAVGDIDRDGRLELVVASVAVEGNPAYGGIFVYESPAAGGRVTWPMLGADAQHDHVYPRTLADDAVVVRHTIPGIMEPGLVYNAKIEIRNTGTSTWTASGGYQLKATQSGDQLRTLEAMSLDSAQVVGPGEVARFTVRLQAPQTPGYYPTEWRMSRGDKPFGLKVAVEVKVGNDPALYLLAKDAARSTDHTAIYPGGVAKPILAPKDVLLWYQNDLWNRAVAFDVLPDGSGYHVVTAEGYTTWSASTPELGRMPYSPGNLWTGLRLTPAGTAFFGMSQDGELRFTEATELLSGVPTGAQRGLTTLPGIPAGQAIDLDVTTDGKGLLVLDKHGRVYAFGNAINLPLPSGLPFPDHEAVAKRIKMTPSGRGYYVLDSYGRLWKTGDAQPLEAHYSLHIGEDWARDFELTGDGHGYYLLDKYGHIYTGGDAAALTVNLPPVWDSDQAVDLMLLDDRKAAPTIVLSQSRLNLITAPGAALPSARIRIQSADNGGPALHWQARTQTETSWLAISPSASTTPSDVVVSVSSMPPKGSYSSLIDIEISRPGGEVLSAVSVPVSLHVVDKLRPVYLPTIHAGSR
jgi:hypothetical protein